MIHFWFLWQAWEMYRTGEFNLSYDSLTSPKTWQILHDLPITEPEFFAELSQRHSHVPLSMDDILHEDRKVSDINIAGDNCSVPLEAVLDAMHGVLPWLDSKAMFEEGPDGVISCAEAEETLIEEVNGVVIDATSSGAQEEGRGKLKVLE
jgi:hypothetical protein